MPKPINKVVFFRNQLFHLASEKTSGPAEFVGIQGVIIYTKADGEGTLNIDIKVDQEWEELVEEPILANKMHIVDLTFFVPELRVRFTPADVETTLKFSVAYGYPSVFIREDLSTKGERDQHSTPGGS